MLGKAKGFTLIELLVVFGGFVLAMGVFDLVELLDWRAYLVTHGVEPSSDSLVRLLNEPLRGDYSEAIEKLASEQSRDESRQALQTAGYMALVELEHASESGNELIREQADALLPSARESWRERKLLLEVACRELARQGANDAVPALRRVAESDDYFLAKHAGKALQDLEMGGEPEVIGLPEEVRAILPEGSEVLVDSRSFKANPGRELRRITAKAGEQNRLNAMIEELNRAIGNVEVRNFRIIGVGGDEVEFHLVIWGRFDQAAVKEWLLSHGAQQEAASDALWAGTLTVERFGLPLQLAMAHGRVIACFVYSPAPRGPVAPRLSTETLMELANAYAGSDD